MEYACWLDFASDALFCLHLAKEPEKVDYSHVGIPHQGGRKGPVLGSPYSSVLLPSSDWKHWQRSARQGALTNDVPSPQFEPGECLLPVNLQGPADFSHYCKLLLLGALHLLLRCNQGFITD